MNESQIAAYLDHSLDPADRERVEGHLAACSDCRHEVADSSRILAGTRRPRRIALAIAFLTIAATLTIIVGQGILSSPAGITSLRGPADPSASIVAYGPMGEVAIPGLRFVWGSVRNVSSYRLVLSGENGVPLWTKSTPDTSLALPDSVVVLPSRTYYWIVDALLGDGSSRSTGLRQFNPVR